MFLCLICNITQVKRISPNDPDASKKLKECEKAVMKLKFEEAIAVPGFEKHSVADSIDFHTIGIILFIIFCRLKHSSSSAKELVWTICVIIVHYWISSLQVIYYIVFRYY